ncbi:MAG TPA: NAD(P)-dependent oxidoreductase [Terriglobales bacterium]|nr:NAD(P)-dependent oxidoreductase [Terriglobales bacterium]
MSPENSKKTVLVLGGAGYVGSVVCHLLLQRGYRVRVLDSLLHGGRSLLGLYQGADFHFIRGDVRDAAVVERALTGADAVIHLAAIVGDPACARQPDLARSVNLEASLQLLRLAQQQGTGQLLFASTCSNYGRMADPTQYVTEESPLAPVSLYAETKVAVEKALLASTAAQPAITVLRFATVFGLSPRMRFDLTVNEFTMELLTKKKLVVFGEQFWRPYIHVRDAARALVMALEAPPEKVRGQVFNVGDTRENYQKKGIVELVRAQVPHPVEIQVVEKHEDPRDYRVSFEKVQKVLAFQITARVPDGIREIAEAIQQGVFSDFSDPAYRN